MTTCTHCGASFSSERSNQCFCSVKCRQASYRRIPWVREQGNIKRRWRRSQKRSAVTGKRVQL
jgi:hypothetical protein